MITENQQSSINSLTQEFGKLNKSLARLEPLVDYPSIIKKSIAGEVRIANIKAHNLVMDSIAKNYTEEFKDRVAPELQQLGIAVKININNDVVMFQESNKHNVLGNLCVENYYHSDKIINGTTCSQISSHNFIYRINGYSGNASCLNTLIKLPKVVSHIFNFYNLHKND